MGDNDKTDEIREQLSDGAVGGTVDDNDGAVLTLDGDGNDESAAEPDTSGGEERGGSE